MKHRLFIFFLLICFFGYSQNNILCEGVSTYIKFESETYVPTVIENPDGTIALVFFEDYITDIFANYKIYDIEHVFASSTNESLQNLYTINFNSKDLIVESQQSVSSNIFYFPDYNTANINTTIIPEEIISTLDSNSFYVSKYNSIWEGNYGAPMKNVPEDFKLSITFNYDLNKDIIYAKSNDITPCGNEFLIGLSGVNNTEAPNNFVGFQLWETISIGINPSEFSQPCYNIESSLYYTLGLCSGVDFNFTTTIEIDNSASPSRITLRRDTAIFGQEIIELSQSNLSVEKNNFEQIELITSKNNAFLNFTNLKNSRYYIEVFSILGEEIIKRIPYQKNSISLNTLSKGIYILRLSKSKGEFKTFKYLN